MTYTIDHVQPGDEAVLAHIQTESWKAAFRDILAPDILAQRTQADKATEMYRRLIETNYGHGYLLRVDAQPHCIAWWSQARDNATPKCAELICIHSLPGRWRQGYGKAMMEAVLRDIKAAGYRTVILWVFQENQRARRFYEECGFSISDKTKENLGAVEVCYQRQL